MTIATQEEPAQPRPVLPRSRFLRPASWWILASALALGLCIHFTLIIFSLLPSSPLQALLISAASRYAYPYFEQNWNFFAPTPVDRTISLVVHARYIDTATGKLEQTPWADVDEPLIEQIRRSRTSPLAVVQLGLSNAVLGYINAVSQDPRFYTLDKDGKTKILHSPLPSDAAPSAFNALTRTALSSLAVQYPGRKFKEVQIGILIHVFPRFNQRSQPDSAGSDGLLTATWQPAVEVPKFCCQSAATH